MVLKTRNRFGEINGRSIKMEHGEQHNFGTWENRIILEHGERSKVGI
jgi:hypothetical protein